MAAALQNIAVSIFFKPPTKGETSPPDGPPPSYNGLTYVPPAPVPVARKPPPPPHPNSHLPRRFPWRAVAIQCASLALSALAIAMTAFVVWVFDGNPVQTFRADVVAGAAWYQPVTLNTVVAWLAAVARTALVLPVMESVGQLKWVVFGRGYRRVSDLDHVDWASRDLFGAVGWIFKFRRGLLIHFGAALMIVSIGVDPLLQQTLGYDLRSVPDTAQPALLSSNPSYTPTRGFSRGLLLATPRALLWGATSSVLGTPVTTAHSCPSGNCTFAAATSVGVCTTCTDITASLTRNCTDLSPTNRFCQSDVCFDSGQLCTYTYSNSTAVAVGGGDKFLAVSAAGANSSARDSATGTVTIPAQRITITALYIQPDINSADNTTQNLPVAPGHVPPGGAHVARGYTCALSFCEQSYTGAVRNGSYTETVHGSSAVDSFVVAVPAAASGITDSLLNQPLAVAPSGATNVSLAALFAMSSGLSMSLTGNATVPTGVPRPGDISEFHRALYVDLLSTDFGAAMARMAASMSAAVRNEGGGVNGTTYVLESYTRARWAWFAFPAGVWVLTAVLVGSVVAQTWRDRGGWLGNSVSAVLMVGVEEEVRRRVDAGGAVVKRDPVAGGLGVWRDSLSVRRVVDELEMRTEIVQEAGVLAMRLKEKVR